MKLYSKKQVLARSFISLLFGIAIAAAFTCINKKYSFTNFSLHSEQKAQNAYGKEPLENSEDFIFQENELPVQLVTDQSQTENQTYTQDELQNISVYEKCNEAVVNITTQVMAYDWFYDPYLTEGGSGSGSIIDARGYVITNVHVIENAKIINISLADGSSYEGKVVGQDKECDIAVLKFDVPSNVKLKTISFGNSDNLKVGQKVIAIGNPFALERTMTTGIISGLGRPIQESTDVIIRNMIQTDAAINPGNSGGPLLDSQGKMIGINTIIYSSSGSSAGVGFAIPVSTARRVAVDLIKYGKVNRGVMKITLVQNTSRIASYAGYGINDGMIISKIQSHSNAEKAGLKGGTQAVQYGSRFRSQTIYLGGDIITAIDNIKVSKLADYYSALEDKVPGEKVTVTVYRNRKYQKFTITLESAEDLS